LLFEFAQVLLLSAHQYSYRRAIDIDAFLALQDTGKAFPGGLLHRNVGISKNRLEDFRFSANPF